MILMLGNSVLKKNIRAVLCLMAVMTLSACHDKSMSDLRLFVGDAFKDKKPEIEPLPVVVPFKGFAYAASEENDPFNLENIVNDQGGSGVASGERPDSNRRKEALEEYPLDTLRLVGTLSQNSKPWVIVQTTQGTVLRAAVGNYMGENNGKIKSISIEEQTVILTETVPDPSGRWVNRDVQIIVDEQ